jgi:NAD-dependent deacetylase
LRGSKLNIVFFTGAGISQQSGIATFRGKNGIYNNDEVARMLSLPGIEFFPEKTWAWLNEFVETINKAGPNRAHEIIASFAESPVITQNIDGYHQKAGSTNVIEFHGGLSTCTCLNCGKKQPFRERCACGSYTKPDFTFFGERINYGVQGRATEVAKSADVLVMVGTSGVILPAAELPRKAAQNGAFIIEINTTPTAFSKSIVDHYIAKDAISGLEEIAGQLHELKNSSKRKFANIFREK